MAVLPYSLAFAFTIHKIQSQTTKAVFHQGPKGKGTKPTFLRSSVSS